MELQFHLALAAVTLNVVFAVAYFGIKVSRAVEKRAVEAGEAVIHITFSGTALFACIVGFLLFCVGTYVLRPGSTFGVFLSDPNGVGLLLLLTVLAAGVSAGILEKLGLPIVRKDS